MMLSCSGITIGLPLKLCLPNTRIVSHRLQPTSAFSCSISINDQRIDTEKLRNQLDQLHAEAESTHSKANNARMRLMRLSEAAENLQKRAASSVLVGKEAEARELLTQKKKLMQALEKSKNRVDVFDKLAVKINEAISLKEAQLIGNVGMYPVSIQEESGRQIRFVDTKEYNDEDPVEINGLNKDCIQTCEDDEQEPDKCEGNLLLHREELSFKDALTVDTPSREDLASNLNGISSYKDFLQYIDGKLQEVEADVVLFLRVANLILETEQKHTSTKVQQMSGLLDDIHIIRERVASIVNAQIDGRVS